MNRKEELEILMSHQLKIVKKETRAVYSMIEASRDVVTECKVLEDLLNEYDKLTQNDNQ